MGTDALGIGARRVESGYNGSGNGSSNGEVGANGAPALSETVAAEVRALIGASEAAGQAIRDRAAAEAAALRQNLRRDAENERHQAIRSAQSEVAQAVGEALNRLMAKSARLDESIAELRAEANRLAVDLTQLDERVASGPEARKESDEERRGRLIALTMAINGASRGETARYLTENVPVHNVEELLDAAYA